MKCKPFCYLTTAQNNKISPYLNSYFCMRRKKFVIIFHIFIINHNRSAIPHILSFISHPNPTQIRIISSSHVIFITSHHPKTKTQFQFLPFLPQTQNPNLRISPILFHSSFTLSTKSRSRDCIALHCIW